MPFAVRCMIKADGKLFALHFQQGATLDSLGRGRAGLAINRGKLADDVASRKDIDGCFVAGGREFVDAHFAFDDQIQIAVGIALPEDDGVLLVDAWAKIVDEDARKSSSFRSAKGTTCFRKARRLPGASVPEGVRMGLLPGKPCPHRERVSTPRGTGKDMIQQRACWEHAHRVEECYTTAEI